MCRGGGIYGKIKIFFPASELCECELIILEIIVSPKWSWLVLPVALGSGPNVRGRERIVIIQKHILEHQVLMSGIFLFWSVSAGLQKQCCLGLVQIISKLIVQLPGMQSCFLFLCPRDTTSLAPDFSPLRHTIFFFLELGKGFPFPLMGRVFPSSWLRKRNFCKLICLI